MSLIQKAALNVLMNGFNVKNNETFVVICDNKNKFFSDALKEACLKLNAKPVVFLLEDFGKRPACFNDTLLNALKTANAGTLCATERENELEFLREPLYNAIRKYPIRFASMTGINREAIETGLNSDFKKIAEFTDKIYNCIKDCKEIRVTTELGTDLTIKCGKYRWFNCNGVLKEGVKDDNYPEGEVFTCPVDIYGEIVVDGVLGDIYDAKYGVITKTPLTLKIENCKAIMGSISCKNKAIANDIKNYILTGDKYASRVGEVALGTNICLDRIIGNLLQDEKFPSFHLAFGDPYGNDTGAGWQSNRHIDMVVLKPDVYVDGNLIMEKGKYKI
ncbi:MAG: aminopeptidase [Candidatus Nanoarchaeia archaeon]|jgi:leucyl aminopeptidase (aminopeptidase T)